MTIAKENNTEYQEPSSQFRLLHKQFRALEDSQLEWPSFVKKMRFYNLHEMIDKGFDSNLVDIESLLNTLAEDGVVFYRRGQYFITWVVINELAYNKSSAELLRILDNDPECHIVTALESYSPTRKILVNSEEES